MNLSKELIKSINNKNREQINYGYSNLYNKYKDIIYFNVFRLVQNQEISEKIVNDSFILIFNNINMVENFYKDLLYLSKQNAVKQINNIIGQEYDSILKNLMISDLEVSVYILNKYDVSFNEIKKELKINSKKLKLILSKNKFNNNINQIQVNIVNNLDYSNISNKLELPKNKIVQNNKLLLIFGSALFIVSILLFIIAFVYSLIPSSKGSFATIITYVSFALLISCVLIFFINSIVNKNMRSRK